MHINNQDINTPIVTTDQLGISRPNNNVDNLFYEFAFKSSGFQIGPTPGADQTQDQRNTSFCLTPRAELNGKHLIRFGGEFDRMALAKKIFPKVFDGELFFSPGTSGAACAAELFRFPGVLTGSCAWRSLTVGAACKSRVPHRAHGPFWARRLQSEAQPGNTIPSLYIHGQNPFVYPTCVNNLNVPGLVGTRNATTLNNNYASSWIRDSGLPTTYSARALHQFAAGIPRADGHVFASSLPKGGVIDPVCTRSCRLFRPQGIRRCARNPNAIQRRRRSTLVTARFTMDSKCPLTM